MIFHNNNDIGLFNDDFQHNFRVDEKECLEALLQQAKLPPATQQRIQNKARQLIVEIREQRVKKSGLDAFMAEYDLSSDEGIALMCLAEAMLRVPDSETADELIADKITSANWKENIGKSDSFFVNASTWALMLTGKVLSNSNQKGLSNVFKKVIKRSGEPFVRTVVAQAMKVLGKQFVMGRDIEEALKRSKPSIKKGYSYSYDMLGEAARTEEDAKRYFQSYLQAIKKIGQANQSESLYKSGGISVKLSALHPRYEYAKRDRVLVELTPKLLKLAQAAKAKNIHLTVDAEEARVLTLSLEVFADVYGDESLVGWEGFGLAVQAYQKRAPFVIDYIVNLYEKHKRRIMVRLIKGAYWDSEIKEAQVEGLGGYPVFTRKHATDASYIACLRKVLQHKTAIYPMFGSHNAYTVAAVLILAKEHRDFEFQCLHGMGDALYDLIVEKYQLPCRIYAPVGGHKDLLAYLVRRLLENGANTSFVNRIADQAAPIEELIKDPVAYIESVGCSAHPKIPLPQDLYGKKRKNSLGIDLNDPAALKQLLAAMKVLSDKPYKISSIINGKERSSDKVQEIYSPHSRHALVAKVFEANITDVNEAFNVASKAQLDWDQTAVKKRAACLLKAADLLQQRMPEFIKIATKEAGKTLSDGVSEVREAIDFCRYYARQAEKLIRVETLPGPTGELNQLSLHGRGVMVCISPWNFPLAIFMGQICAALVTGNAVLAKPAEQTPAMAYFAIKLLHEAGVPKSVLHLLLGAGEKVGAHLVNMPHIAGVMFTGSTITAKMINQTLAAKEGPIVPLVAETGGQNCMIVDSSALHEQVVLDVVSSAFGSAGQRCSALRVLYVQDDIADDLIHMLKGAMRELSVGDPNLLSTDVGPVIDDAAMDMLMDHFHDMHNRAKFIYQVELDEACHTGHFFAPCAFEIEHIKQLKHEVFGPFLHVIRYKASKLEQVLDDIAATGYGLTQGLHSRINERVSLLQKKGRVGNLYVNRNTIGAVVGVQPFGGEGLSGTGPKAGGPHYLLRLLTERTLTVDTTASGGNASLLTLSEEDE